MGANYYLPGGFNVTCDRTGFKIKNTDAVMQWDGLIVRRQSVDPRHPQDFVHGIAERSGVPNARPRPAPRYVTVNEITQESL